MMTQMRPLPRKDRKLGTHNFNASNEQNDSRDNKEAGPKRSKFQPDRQVSAASHKLTQVAYDSSYAQLQ